MPLTSQAKKKKKRDEHSRQHVGQSLQLNGPPNVLESIVHQSITEYRVVYRSFLGTDGVTVRHVVCRIILSRFLGSRLQLDQLLLYNGDHDH